METKSIAWDSGGGYIRLTYGGSGNGTISVESDANTLGTSRSKNITIQTVGGVVTKNLTVSQAACPFPVGDVRNYSYTGSYQEVELPAGKYKLQCWGAQGGSNGTNSAYGITAKAGGKGGYSEGVLTLSQKTTVRVYVGGHGSSSSGGYNGGGSTSGTSQYNYGNEFGYSKMGGGGGATDIRLYDGALLSRMIVAGGGSGGAMCYRAVETTTTETVHPDLSNQENITVTYINNQGTVVADPNILHAIIPAYDYVGWTISITCSYCSIAFIDKYPVVGETVTRLGFIWEPSAGTYTDTIPSGTQYILVYNPDQLVEELTISHQVEYTDESSDYQVGFAGGGTNGAGYSSAYQGKQASAGSGGSFGQGANQTVTNYRYASGAGGGGWYGGGGGRYSDSTMSYCKQSGGGSGWVNIAANAGNRPSGYTGLELDSGTTYAGNTSFPSTGGGTETGHSGNGYARITRLE